MGGSATWDEVLFDDSFDGDQGVLYAVFQLPSGSVKVGEGEGGGAGIGVLDDGFGLAGMLSVDGVDWAPLHHAFGLAVSPVLVERDGWTITLARATKSNAMEGTDQDVGVVVLETLINAPGPNPFNPKTSLRFSLAEATRVELEIFDVRGRLVRRLADHVYSAGGHTIDWLGRDDDGRDVASGTYLAVIRAGGLEKKYSLVLIR